MAKYLYKASYTAEGAKGLMKDGGSKRRQSAEAAIKSAGGKMEAFYFGFGTDDVYALVDLPDNVSAAAMSLAIAGSGVVNGHLVVLLTAEELDQAAKKSVTYTPPGK